MPQFLVPFADLAENMAVHVNDISHVVEFSNEGFYLFLGGIITPQDDIDGVSPLLCFVVVEDDKQCFCLNGLVKEGLCFAEIFLCCYFVWLEDGFIW